MSVNPPSPPDTGSLAAQQNQYGLADASQAIAMSQANVNTPGASTTWSGVGGPNPTATQAYSPTQQALYGQYQAGQLQGGGVANEILKGLGLSGNYGKNLPSFTSLTAPLMQQQEAALAPWFSQQKSNLQGQLANQGIGMAPGGPGGMQGTDAYSNAMRNLDVSQTAALMQAEPQFFQQAMQQYQLPINTMMSLFGMGAPQGINPPQIPQSQQIQPPNLLGAAVQNYQNQLVPFQSTMAGLGNIGSALTTGLFGLGKAGYGLGIPTIG